jgi:TPR repeat protein
MYHLHHYVSAKTARERGDYDVALAQAIPIAKQGEVWALNLVGLMYLNGQGLPPNRDTGLHLIHQAAEKGWVNAHYNLTLAYLQGEWGVPVNAHEGIRWLSEAAKQNYTPTQFALGEAYLQGIWGLSADLTRGIHWLRIAAEQNYVKVQFSLGLAHKDGSGVPINMQEAVRWFHNAAVQGYARAQHNMGVAYGQGVGVSADPAEAVRWLRKAGEQGLALSQYNQGWEVPVDVQLGVHWLCEAAVQGHTQSPTTLTQFETARQQPSYTYPGSEYDTFGAKMWRIFQGGDVKQIEEAARGLGTINRGTKGFNQGEQDGHRRRQEHLEQLYRDEILRELGRQTRYATS